MLFKITQIEFDFTDDNNEEALSLEDQINLLDEVKDGLWEAEDEEDLVEKLTSIYGWCINSINFETFESGQRTMLDSICSKVTFSKSTSAFKV